MTRDSVIGVLKQLEPRLRGYGVDALYLYGSYARDDAGPQSDLDILVDFAEGEAPDFQSYIAPYEALEQSFPAIEIGYGTRANIVPRYRSYIEQSAIRIF